MILLFLWLVEVADKRVELRLPVTSVAGEERGGVLQWSGDERATVDPAVLLAIEEPRAFEDSEVLGDGGQGHMKRGGQFRHR